MKKLFTFLFIISLTLLVSCPGEPDEKKEPPTPPPPPEKTYADFDTWNEWLAYKYGKEFGWDKESLGAPGTQKAPIEHNMSAEEYLFSKGINAGWNLGNTHDLSSNPRADTGHYEKLFPGIKAAGFNVIRIPVTWGGNSSGTGAATTISTAWLDTVAAAVEAAHAAGMVVFFNTHHDKTFFNLTTAGASLNETPLPGGGWGDGGTVFQEMTARFQAVWTQIATRFKDYGDWLIFEGMNEPTITDNTGATAWDGANPWTYEVLNRWFQTFVDAVRATGGNNEKRYLIFKSYAAKLNMSLDPTNGFRIPTDPNAPATGPGRLIYSFHMYVPQPLGLEGTNTTWTDSHVRQYISLYEQTRLNYSLKGIPVFMGETGATFHSQRGSTTSTSQTDQTVNTLLANKNRLLMLNAMGNKARLYGVTPCLWDNGEGTHSGGNQPNGETFAMFRRKTAHDNNSDNWGLPINHTILAGGSVSGQTTGGTAMNATNGAREDPDFGAYTLKAFIDAINGRRALGDPEYTPKQIELGLP